MNRFLILISLPGKVDLAGEEDGEENMAVFLAAAELDPPGRAEFNEAAKESRDGGAWKDMPVSRD